jgi:hypothetical protein
MFTRVLDLAVLALVAVAVLLPRPDVQVQPALKLDPEHSLRVAELEAQLAADPGETTASLELADLFLDGHRPDWALATVMRAIDRSDKAGAPPDFRLHFRRALALADHFEATAAFAAAERALALCTAATPGPAPCGPTERARIELLHSTLERVNGLDMRQDPNAARARIMQGLRPTYIPPPPRKPTDTKKAAQ